MIIAIEFYKIIQKKSIEVINQINNDEKKQVIGLLQ